TGTSAPRTTFRAGRRSCAAPAPELSAADGLGAVAVPLDYRVPVGGKGGTVAPLVLAAGAHAALGEADRVTSCRAPTIASCIRLRISTGSDYYPPLTSQSQLFRSLMMLRSFSHSACSFATRSTIPGKSAAPTIALTSFR